jgi:hypothetical protein
MRYIASLVFTKSPESVAWREREVLRLLVVEVSLINLVGVKLLICRIVFISHCFSNFGASIASLFQIPHMFVLEGSFSLLNRKLCYL